MFFPERDNGRWHEEPHAPIYVARIRLPVLERIEDNGEKIFKMQVFQLIDQCQLNAKLSDGYLLCTPTVEMFEKDKIPPETFAVLIPRTWVRGAASAADWIDCVPGPEEGSI